MAEYESTEAPKTRFEELRGWVKTDRRYLSDWYKEANKDYDFYAGGEQQWETADREALEDAEKPWTSFNFIQPSVSAVNGMEVSNRQEVNFLPRTTQVPRQPNQPPVPGANDQGPAETLKGANDYLRDQCDAEDEESDAFQDTAICGVGCTETRVDFEENPQGDMVIDRCDPTEMGWDCQASKRNIVDARRIHRVRTVDIDAAKTMFPDHEIHEIDAAWAKDVRNDTSIHDQDEAEYYKNNQSTDQYGRKTVTLCEITWYDTKVTYTVASPETGEVLKDLDKSQVSKLRERAKKLGLKLAVQTVKSREYKQAFLGSDKILGEDQDGDPCQSQKGFKFKFITGWRNKNKKQWMGIVRAMRDPQRWANALYSSTLNTIMTSGKGIMAERGAFEKPTEAEKDWASSGNIVWLNPGALSGQNPKVMQKVPNPLPPGIDRMMEFALTAMQRASGVNLETLGATDRDQAASLEYQRRQASQTILAPFFDGLRRYRKEQGRLSMDLIRNHLSDGRLVRIVGPDYEGYVPLIKQDETIEYDIIVSESPTSPNQKEASWATTQSILPVVGKNLGPNSTAALLKATPLPESTVKEFTDAIQKDAEAAAQQPNPEMEKLKADIQMKQMDAETNQRKAEQDLAITQQKASADLQLKSMDIRLKEMEIQLAQFQAGANVEQTRMQAENDQKKMDMELRAKQADADNAANAELTKTAGPQLPAKFDALAKGLEALGRGFAEGMAQIAKSQVELTKAITAPRVTTVDDPLTGQKMTATSTTQMVN